MIEQPLNQADLNAIRRYAVYLLSLGFTEEQAQRIALIAVRYSLDRGGIFM
jgi:hypothetical protein